MEEVDNSWLIAYRALNAKGEYDSVNRWRELFGTNFPQTI